MPDALVLIVDDNPLNRKLARDLLQHSGYATLEAGTAIEGIELARANLPDLVLLDVQLPDIDGIEALKRMRADRELAGTMVLAFTAFAMKGDRDRFLSAGFDGYLAKP